MDRRTVMIGAASSIGIRPDDDGSPRWLDRAPAALRARDLATRIGASDDGDLVPPPYRDFVRPAGGIRNEEAVTVYSQMLAVPVAEAAASRRFALVLGGDCSIVLGCCLGLRRGLGRRVGLVYVDAHSDFATPAESVSGSAAAMCLGLAVGRSESPLARLAGDEPLVRGSDVVLVGRRDGYEPWYGQNALEGHGVLDIDSETLLREEPGRTAWRALARVTRDDLAGFWLHLDADVFDPQRIPAVDSPEPGGPDLPRIAALLEPLLRHPKALGLELTIYDPRRDPDGICADRLADLLSGLLAPATAASDPGGQP